MKQGIPFLLFIFLLTLIQSFLPWYAAFGVAFLWFYIWTANGVHPGWFGFFAGATVWLLMAGYREWQGPGQMAGLLGAIMGELPEWSVYTVTALLGGLITGAGAWLGRKARVLGQT